MAASIIISTYPDKKSVQKIANMVVKNHLVACVNVTKINSIYVWKGKMEKTNEFLAFFKTTDKTKNALKKEIKKLHPYEVPEIVEITVNSINKSYLNWLIDSTRNKSQKRDHSAKR